MDVSLFHDYAWWQSPHHQAGTLIGVRRNIALTTQPRPILESSLVTGRISAILPQTPNDPIVLISAYCPSQTSPTALEQRKNLDNHINSVMNAQKCIPVLMGDMNATYKSSDRSSSTTCQKDKQYRGFLEGSSLKPIDAHLPIRPCTFKTCTESNQNCHNSYLQPHR